MRKARYPEDWIRMQYRQAADPEREIGILAQLCALSRSEIRQIVRDVVPIRSARKKRTYTSAFWTEERVAELVRLRAAGLTQAEVGKKLGCTQVAVSAKECRLRRAE